MWQCGNVGRRALRSGAPAVTPSGSAQAGNAQCPMPNASRSVNCHINHRMQNSGKMETPVPTSAHHVFHPRAPGTRCPYPHRTLS